MASGAGSPCGACKFLRRRCAADCVFAPYFCSEQGLARFAAIHKVFGASNASKLLLHVPVADRCEAVVTIAYEAQARIRDPVYGCVAHIFALQQQVAYLQAQVMQMKALLAQNMVVDHYSSNQWLSSNMVSGIGSTPLVSTLPYSISPQSSLDSIDGTNSTIQRSDILQNMDEVISFQPYSKKRPPQTDLSELQALALTMMNNENRAISY